MLWDLWQRGRSYSCPWSQICPEHQDPAPTGSCLQLNLCKPGWLSSLGTYIHLFSGFVELPETSDSNVWSEQRSKCHSLFSADQRRPGCVSGPVSFELMQYFLLDVKGRSTFTDFLAMFAYCCAMKDSILFMWIEFSVHDSSSSSYWTVNVKVVWFVIFFTLFWPPNCILILS